MYVKRRILTLVVMLAMMSAGVNIGIYNPTFPSMEVTTSSNIAQMSTTVIWIGLASGLGALSFGCLYEQTSGIQLLGVCLVLEGIAVGLSPSWPSLPIFQALTAAASFFNFAIMSVCISINRSLWVTSVAWLQPVIQATDIMHTIGTAITPLIAQPFVATSFSRQDTGQKSNVSQAIQLNDPSPVQTVYALVGTVDIAVAFICLIVSCLFTVDVVLPESRPDSECHAGGDGLGITRNTDDLTRPARAKSDTLLVLIVSLFFVVSGGRDALLSTMLFTYVSEYSGWTAAAGSLLVTTYHVTRAVVQAVLVVPVSRSAVPLSWLMMFDVVILVMSAILMLAALIAGDVLTVVGVIVTALATSNVHRTTMTVVGETIDVTAPVLALFIAALGVGQSVATPLSGHLLQTAGAASYPAMLLALALTALALFCLYCVVLKHVHSTYTELSTHGTVVISTTVCL